ncbi:hypothetical protein SDC9_148092 [bioreactor metagenome]|uniref:Uncharacterized protein n=1 Tax=bioreactor metagenome TaxID=1076179 RepID=A0A645EJK0_9ZZZZ
MPCPVIEQVQPVHAVELLAVVLVRLDTSRRAFTGQPAKRIVVVHLLHRPVPVEDDTVVALMVPQVVMVNGCRA